MRLLRTSKLSSFSNRYLSLVVATSLLGIAACSQIGDEKTGASSLASEESDPSAHESKIATLYVYDELVPTTPSPTPTPEPIGDAGAIMKASSVSMDAPTADIDASTLSTMEIIDYFEVERLTGDPDSVREILSYGQSPGVLYMIESGSIGSSPPPMYGGGGMTGIRAVTEGENNGMRAWVAAGMLAFAWGGVQLEIAHLDHEIKEAREKGDFGKINDLENERKVAQDHLKEIADAAKELREHLGEKDRVRGGGTNGERVADFFSRLNERSTKIQGVMDKAAVKQAMEYSAKAKNRGGGFNYGRDVKERRKR